MESIIETTESLHGVLPCIAPATPPHAPVKPLVRLERICKSFGPVKANDNITLDIRPARIKALLGENGAGKSTLMSMLAGQSSPDSGCIFVDGRPVNFTSPKDALAAGIGMVYQHFMLVNAMTVTENLILGQSSGLLWPKKMKAKVQDLASHYGLDVHPDARIADLSMGERQRVEILKLLTRDCRILILDEPTAVLTTPEIDQLFESLRRMAREGKAIVFISHKMKEVLELADEIDILRRGTIVDSFLREDVKDAGVLASRMIGSTVEEMSDAEPVEKGECLLRVENLSGGQVHNISFHLRRGEVLAVTGVAGNGQSHLVEMLCGLRKPDEGQIDIMGQSSEVFFKTRADSGGLVYIPEDRKGVATCPSLNLVDNFLLTNRFLFEKNMMIDHSKSHDTTRDIISDYQVLPGNMKASAGSLSGGNLQKLVLGREFFRNPRLIIAENPTQGLDVGAMTEVWRRILAARNAAGVLLVTSDLAEAMRLADTFAVMYRGSFMDVFPRSDERKLAQIGLLMAGMHPDESHPSCHSLATSQDGEGA